MKGTQSFPDPPSNGTDREMRELARELEETKFAKERLETELRSVSETSEKRKRALDDALAKLQDKKQEAERQSQELNRRAEDIDIENHKLEEIRATLVQKESSLKGVNSAHEHLRARFNEMQKRMENENRVLARALDDANANCEERERGMKKYMGEIENLRSVIANLQKKCSNAEAIAEENMNRIRQLESDLDSRGATLAVFSENKSNYDVLKMKLAECERTLAQESAHRASAERALEELRNRDGHLLKVEKEHNSVQQQLKWRKEQFGLLEDAYKKLQKQFQDGKEEWEREKAGMISEMSSIQDNFETQSRLSKDLQLQLQRCNQALAHEENRRKVLEIQVEESRYGFEKVAAEFEEARSVIESLTEKSSKEVGLLRDSLACKERQMREMEVKQTHMKQENQVLQNMVEEFQASKSGSEQVYGSLERLKMKYMGIEEAYNECRETLKMKESQWEKERDEVLKTLNDCQIDLQSKDAKVHDLCSQLEGARASAERLACQKAELSQKLLILESQYQEDQSKMNAENLTLESSCRRKNEEVACLKEQLQARQKTFEQIQQELTQRERTIETMSARCEFLKSLEADCSVMREDLQRKQEQLQSLSKSQSILQDQILQKEQRHIDEVQKVREALEEASASIHAKEQKEEELQNELKRFQEILEKNQAIHFASEVKVEEYQHQLQELQQQLSEAKQVLVHSQEKKKTDTNAFLDAIKVKDRKIEELKDQIMHFEQKLNGLSQQEESWLQLQLEYNQLSDQRIRDHESLSVANAKVESIAKQLLEKEQERNSLQKCLESKEADLGKLKKESEALIAEKSAIIYSIKVQEEKYTKLIEEYEQNKLALQRACIKLEVADSELAHRDQDIAELRQKVKHGDMLQEELSEAERKTQQLEGLLEEARSSLKDKEERTSELEITVEQLRNEVLVVKLELAEKEKDEAILEGKLRDAEKEVRAKEERLLEMDSNLNKKLKESEEKQAEILCLRDEVKEIEKRLSESEERHASDMEAQLKSYRAALAEKVSALNVADMEVQRERNALEDTKDAVEHLKHQLSIEEKTSFDRQSHIEHLSKELEMSKIAENQSSETLKKMQGRLEQLEQDSEDQIRKLENSVIDLQNELSETWMKMVNFEKASKFANEELSTLNEKRTALEQLLSAKDEALEAKEKAISSLQADIEQQAEIILKAQLDLQHVQDRLLGELESRENLEKTVSCFRDQVTELQKCKQELEGKSNSIHRDYQTAMKIVVDRDVSISCLEEKLRAYEVQVEECKVAAGNHEEVIRELSQKLHVSEGKTELLEDQSTRLQRALEGAVDSLKEETNEVSSLSHSFDELKILLVEIKMDTVSGLKDGMAYAAQFKDVINVLDNIQLKLDIIQKKENDLASRMTSLDELLEESQSVSIMHAKQIDLLTNTLQDLHSQLLEWKNKATNSAEVVEQVQIELENAKQVISSLQEQLDECQAMQEHLKKVEDSTISSVETDVLRDLEKWKATAMSAAEEMKRVNLQLKLSEDNVRELSSNIKAYETKERHMEKEYSLLEEEIQNSLSSLRDEMDKFFLVCSSIGEEDGEFEKLRHEIFLNHKELRATLSAVRDELKRFEIFMGQFQSYDLKFETMQEQLSVLQSHIDKEREKANYYAKSMEGAEVNLAIWKEKVDVMDCQNKVLHGEVEILNRSVDELRKAKEEGMVRERQLQDEISAIQESLENLNCNIVEETERASALLCSINSIEEERNNLLEKVRFITEENRTTKLELEAAKMELSQLGLHVVAGSEQIKNLEEMNKKLKCELVGTQEEIQTMKDNVHKFLSQLQNMQVEDSSLRLQFQAIHYKILKNWDMEEALAVFPKEGAKNKEGVRDSIDDFKSSPSLSPSNKTEVVQSADENVPRAVKIQQLNGNATETRTMLPMLNKDIVKPNLNLGLYEDVNHLQVCDILQKIQGKHAEESVQELMKQLESALITLVGKNAAIEKLCKEVENMQSVVRRLEQRNSQLEQHKDSSTIDPERFFHYTQLCDSLIRDQLRLKKKLEMAERKNQVLVNQIEEVRQSMQPRTPLEEATKDRKLNEKQDENLVTPKTKLQTEVGSGHGSSERSPLQVLNY